jgi:predicted transcriptional regulator of viral defense system
MNWIAFRNQMFDLGCFSIHQVYAWQPGFDRNNFVRWTRKGYLVRLRQGVYAFPEYKAKPDSAAYFAGKIYSPSYISLHSALAFYGLIPESVVQMTSVTSRKTARFRNDFGEYSYQSVRADLMFGYVQRPLAEGRTLTQATREKALLDLLYLYPFYKTEADLAHLRLDGDVLHEHFNRSDWEAFLARFQSVALEARAQLLMKVYGL